MGAILGALSGCSTPSPAQWGWMRCYEGPPRAFSDVSVLLVDGGWLDTDAYIDWGVSQPYDDPKAPRLGEWRSVERLRILWIDGAVVPDCREYHLLPGLHSIRARAAGQQSDTPLATHTLRAGHVYKLSADILSKTKTVQRLRTEIKATWRMQFEDLGQFAELTATPGVHPTVYRGVENAFLEAPPRHWGVIEGWEPEANDYADWFFGEWKLREDGIWQPLHIEGWELKKDGTWKLPPRDQLLQQLRESRERSHR